MYLLVSVIVNANVCECESKCDCMFEYHWAECKYGNEHKHECESE